MITAIIFFAHLLFILIIFTKKWQDENLTNAFLNGGLIAILFTVGWSIAGIPTKYLVAPEGFGIYYDRDAITLTLLCVGEYFFYRMYYPEYFKKATAPGKGT